jgi:Ser/Thr protein kinase RdoA (MazF antagonist)
MAASVLTERAMRAASHVAREHGLTFDEPEVVHEGSNLLLHLHPAPVVARVATTTAMVRSGDAWLTREVAVASHAAAAGAPIVAPSAALPPGPHHFSGLTMTFWEHVAEVPGPVDAERAGRALRDCHEALRDYPGDLPPMAVMREAEQMIERFAADGTLNKADADLLRRAAAEANASMDALGLPSQAIHGDAHLGNVINTPAGPLWTDWEDTFLGPTAWDLGCLRASGVAFDQAPDPGTAALAGYGSDAEDAFVAGRRLQGTVWMLVFARDQPELRPEAEQRLAWYRDHK